MKKPFLLGLSIVFLTSCLALKVLATRATWGTLDRGSISDALSVMLETNGFVIASRTKFDVYEVILAFSPTCGLTAAPLAEEGHEKRMFETLAKPGEHVFYVFNGTVRTDLPLVEAIANKYMDRILRGVGVADSMHPLYAGIAAPGCEVEKLGWKSLAKLPWQNIKERN